MDLSGRNFQSEMVFSSSRSSGPGGQNVNKVSTKVELRFHVGNSLLLSDEEKNLIISKLSNKINKQGEIVLVAQSERSQIKNREKVISKFYLLISRALTPRRKRIFTVPSKASIEIRLESKRMLAKLKENRKDVEL